jgi:hypothetical protein
VRWRLSKAVDAAGEDPLKTLSLTWTVYTTVTPSRYLLSGMQFCGINPSYIELRIFSYALGFEESTTSRRQAPPHGMATEAQPPRIEAPAAAVLPNWQLNFTMFKHVQATAEIMSVVM